MTKRMRLLVVEDDASMRRSIGRLLTAAGFECIEFGSAEELLQSAHAPSPTCLITDIHLPGMSGLELVDVLRAKHPKMPAVLITAYDDARTRELALRRHHIAYLAKPFEGTALLEAIRKVTMFQSGLPP
jgi:FixJ family two-component response regulator